MKSRLRVGLVIVLTLMLFFITSCNVGVTGNFSADVFRALDYSLAKNWVYLFEGDEPGKMVDLFLICQTAYRSVEPGNMPMDNEYYLNRFLRALDMQRGIYEDTCRMFAPFYRQASMSVYETGGPLADVILDMAYEDVRASFLYYMENLNDGRPFVLAGFSQGADMALRLMKEFFADESISGLLVAAYIIGWSVTPDDILQNPHLQMAEEELDLGVIVSFNTEAVDVTTSFIVPDKTLGINPLSWTTGSGTAPRELAKGACFFNADGVMEYETPNISGAFLCPVRGTLKLIDINPADFPNENALFGEGVYHIYDYQFFFRDLQANVAVRADTYLRERTSL